MTTARRKSKLDPYVDLIGVLSDREVADKAGVSSENVRTFRLRRGIPAKWRGETAVEVSKRGKKPKGRRKAKSTRPRAPRPSKLDPFKELLGEVPDKQVAAKAGVTVENVRAYRLRRGIAAAWRGKSRAAAGATAASRSSAATNSSKSAARSDVHWAYRVVADVADGRKEFVVIGSDMASAARTAGARLQDSYPGAFLREIGVVGEAL